MNENEVSGQILDAAIKVHRALGHGLFESAYEAALSFELQKRGLSALRQVAQPIVYETLVIEEGYRIDMIVENLVIVELKSVEKIIPVHKKQLLTYLKLSGKKLGLLINFNEILLKDGVTRIVNDLNS